MTEIERRLRELGSVTRRTDWERPFDPRLRKRIRRRRVMLPAGAVCAAVAIAASGAVLPERERRPRRDGAVIAPAASAPNTPEPRLALREVSEDGFSAVWPEDNAAAATDGCAQATTGTFRSDPVAMASAFGREVMGWRDTTATVTGSTEGSRQVELRRGAASRVNVSVVELVEGCWAVQSVFDAPGDRPTGLVMDSTPRGTGAVVRVRFDGPAGASGRVEVGYGDYVETRTWDGPVTSEDPIVVELREQPATTGHLFVLFEDETGAVTKALAYSLPPRHFSKGARERAEGP